MHHPSADRDDTAERDLAVPLPPCEMNQRAEKRMEASRLLKVQEVARMLAISVREVWRRADSGMLPKPIRLGGKIRRWLREEIEAVIDKAIRQRGT